MNSKRSYWRIATSLAFGALFASHCWADNMYIRAIGQRQGTFAALSAPPTLPGFVAVTKFAFDMHAGIDPATGLINGRRQYSPVRITKLLDPSSAQYLQAGEMNETLTSVTIQFFATMSDGKVYNVRTLVLNNAQVVGVEHYTEPDANGAPVLMEQISLNFQKYTWSENVANLSVTDSILPAT